VLNYPALTTSIDKTRTPPFHEMNVHPKRFENLTAHVLSLEANLHRSELFGIDGEAQFGIDVIADRREGGGREVASCKCYPKVTVANIKAWSDDFLAHWDSRWKSQDVRRFVLVTSAANITQVSIRDQRDLETARFAALGVEYEVWGPEELARKMAGDRAGAERFLDKFWADRLCGELPLDPALFTTVFNVAQTTELHSAQRALGEQAGERVEAARDHLRTGDLEACHTVTSDLRRPEIWPRLSPELQARVARLQGAAALHQDELGRAQHFSDEADALHPDEPRLAAHLAKAKQGPLAGLARLGTPNTLAGRQLQISLLLEVGRVEEAHDALSGLLAEAPDDAESQRLAAFIHLLKGNRQDALTAVQRAEGLAPRLIAVIRTGAIVRHALALSPVAPITAGLHPSPVAECLCKIDDASVAMIEAALGKFQDLLAKVTPWKDLAYWQLACLAKLPGRAKDAEAALAGLLDQAPGAFEALHWAYEADLAFDKARSLDAVRTRFEAGRGEPNDPALIIWLMSSSDQAFESAFAYLKAHLDRQSPEVAKIIRLKLARLEGEPVEPNPGEDQEDEDTTALQAEELVALAEDKPDPIDWATLDRRLASQLDPAPSEDGFNLASAAASRGRWTALEPHIEALACFETAAAILLAAHAAHHTRAPNEVLRFLDRHRGVFPGGTLPLELRRMQVVALGGAGEINAAIAAAERLGADRGLLDDRLQLVQLHLSAGHVQAVLPMLQVMLAAKELSADDALRYSIAVTREDVHLARALWRTGVAAGVSDGILLHAFSQGYRLGLDVETNVLSPRLHQRAASGANDIWMVGEDDLVEQIRAHQTRQEEVYDHLKDGVVPIHMATRALNSIGQIYRLDRPTDATAMGPMFIRHGGRPRDFAPPAPWAKWRVHLDVTALLLADQLGLLDPLEGLDAPVIVSRSLPDSLYQLEQDVGHQQPRLIDAAREVLTAMTARRLRTASNDAPPDETWVRHERVRDEISAPGPTLASLQTALRNLGELNAPAPETDPAGEQVITPQPGARLVFCDNVMVTLAAAGLLEGVLRHFRCEIQEQEAERLRQEVQAFETRDILAERYRQLRGRLARGLQSNPPRYVFAPTYRERKRAQGMETAQVSATEANEDDTADHPHADSAAEQSLLDLITAPTQPQGMVWVDDRYTSGFVKAEGNLVIGVVEVLNALARDGVITPLERREKLLKLRAAGAAFIPIGADEVWPALEAAAVVDGALIETPALAVLRRNLATALAFDQHLKLGASGKPSLRDRPDETPFLQSSRIVLQDIFKSIWSAPNASPETCRARSDWVWRSLRIERCVRILPGDDNDTGNETLFALLLAGLLGAAQQIGRSPATDPLAGRRDFLAWLDEVALQPHVDDTRFLDLVALQLKGLLDFEEGDLPDGVDWALIRRSQSLAVSLFPSLIRERLLDDEIFVAKLSIPVEPVITIEGLRFSAQRFWPACGRALRKGAVEISSLEGPRVKMTASGDVLTLSGTISLRISEGSFPALRARGRDRLVKARAYCNTLDLSADDLETVLQRLGNSGSDVRLIEALNLAESFSPSRRYGLLSATIQARKPAGIDLFQPPPVARLRHYLRLAPSDRPMTERMAKAWTELATGLGPAFAFRRLAGLPLALGDILAASEHGPDLISLAGLAHTTLQRLHLARAAHLMGRREAYADQITAAIEGGATDARLLITVLHWTSNAFQNDPAWEDLDVVEQLILIWSHAEQVSAALTDVGFDVDNACAFFENNPVARHIGDSLVRRAQFDTDCASPTFFSAPALIYHGVAYVLTGEPDVLAALPEPMRGRLIADLMTLADDVLAPQFGLVIRAGPLGNALGSFLNQHPAGVLVGDDDPVQMREKLIDDALDRIEQSTDDLLAWRQLLALSGPSLPTAQMDRLKSAFSTLSFRELCQEASTEQVHWLLNGYRRQDAALTDQHLSIRVRDMAEAFFERFPMPADLKTPAGDAAFTIALETIASCAIAETSAEALSRLHRFSLQLVSVWPASVGLLRDIFSSVVGRTPPHASAAAWETFVHLRRWP
jgi:hypothetical protein